MSTSLFGGDICRMSATPVVPGRAYRVRGGGLDITWLAGHACDAICGALRLLSAESEA